MTNVSTALSLLILISATIDDLRTRKIHNILLGILAVVTLIGMTWAYGISGFEVALLGSLTGFLMYLPLAYFGAVGGGDLKLLTVLGLCLGMWGTILVGTYALLWGAFLGVVQVAASGQLKILFLNLWRVSHREKIDRAELHKIPYSAALLLATLTQWTLHHHRGEFL